MKQGKESKELETLYKIRGSNEVVLKAAKMTKQDPVLNALATITLSEEVTKPRIKPRTIWYEDPWAEIANRHYLGGKIEDVFPPQRHYRIPPPPPAYDRRHRGTQLGARDPLQQLQRGVSAPSVYGRFYELLLVEVAPRGALWPTL